MILKSVIFAWITLPTIFIFISGCGSLQSDKNERHGERNFQRKTDKTPDPDGPYQADQDLVNRCQSSTSSHYGTSTDIELIEHEFSQDEFSQDEFFQDEFFQDEFSQNKSSGQTSHRTVRNWKLCTDNNPIKQSVIARKKKAIDDAKSKSYDNYPDQGSPGIETPETWLIGRKVSDVQFALASKSGREWQTQDFWSDEPDLSDTENLAVLNTLQPDKEITLSFRPKFIEEGFSDEHLSIELVKFKDKKTAEMTLRRWQDTGKIAYYEPNQTHEPMAATIPEFAKEYIDTDASNPWHTDIRLAETFNALSTGVLPRPNDADIFANAPVIAVIDSGVDVEHRILKNAIWENPAPGVLCQDDLHGCNTSADFNKNTLGDGAVWPVGTSGFNETCPTSLANCTHGTHVAGIIAGYDADSKIGVCPFCKILPIRVSKLKNTSEGGSISDSSIIRALQYISQFSRGGSTLIRLANASFGKYQRSRSVASLVRKLAGLQGGGILMIAAASNEDSIQNAYPAALPEALSVAALETSKKKATFSNYGISVDIAAPGRNIESSIPGPGNDTMMDSGTSMAAPVVTGVAALVLSLQPELDAAALRTRLIETANSYIYSSEVEGGYNSQWYYNKLSTGERVPLLGSGIVDAYAAVENNRSQAIQGSAKTRIAPGCSQLKQTPSAINPMFFIALIALPLILGAIHPRIQSKNPLSRRYHK